MDIYSFKSPYAIPASLKLPYNTAIPIARIANEKKPGTIFNMVGAQVDVLYKAPLVTAAVDTCVAIGPIRTTPIKIAMKPLINLAII
jgi:hypothetical protein